MNSKAALKPVVVLVAILLLGVFIYFVGIPALMRSQMAGMMDWPQPVGGHGEYQGATYCATCHPQQFAEWKESLMAMATTESRFEPRFKQLSWAMTREQCFECHAPLQNREEGISCEVCHGPGQTMKVVEEVCFGCHQSQMEAGTQTMLSTPAEFLQSAAHREGKTCVDCHMRTPDGNVSHRFEGSRTTPEVYRGTVIIESVERKEGQLVVVVRNNVSGHYLPTGAPENVLFLEVTGHDDKSEVVYQREVRFEKESWWFRTMPMMVKSDTRLKDGEQRKIVLDVPSVVTNAKARLIIRPILWNGEVVRVVVDEKATEG